MTSPSAPSALDLFARRIAYFSMEIALSKDLPTYSGGLGMLAGDTLRSAADTGVPVVAVLLAHRCGYFRQHLDAAGQQTETDVPWRPEFLPLADAQICIRVQDRELHIRAWRFDVIGVNATSSPSSCSIPTSTATIPGIAASPTASTAATPSTGWQSPPSRQRRQGPHP